MSSLRARIIAGVLPLVAIGLIVLAAITYFEQRSFLLGQVDVQLRTGINSISQFLDQRATRCSCEGQGRRRHGRRSQTAAGGGPDGSAANDAAPGPAAPAARRTRRAADAPGRTGRRRNRLRPARNRPEIPRTLRSGTVHRRLRPAKPTSTGSSRNTTRRILGSRISRFRSRTSTTRCSACSSSRRSSSARYCS